MKKLTKITKTAIDSDNQKALSNLLVLKVNEIADEINRMNGFEAGTVKEIDHSPCSDKDPIQTLAAIRDRLLPLVDNTSECGDMLACTGSRTECVQGLVEQIVDQYYNICDLIRNDEEWVYLSESIQSKVEKVLSSIKKGGSDE